MAAAAVRDQILPSRLMNFFARYPPQLYSAKYTKVTIPLTRQEAKEAAIARAAAAAAEKEVDTSGPTPGVTNSTTTPTVDAPLQIHTFPPNPFLPRKNTRTGRWSGARIGLRRQAELVKLAKKYSIEELLPPGRKSTAFKEQRILQRGLRIKGTGEGQKVKGHKWERKVGATLEKRRAAMEKMPEIIREWKQRGHGRGWKKYPK